MVEIDALVAEVVAHMAPTARDRLNRFVRNSPNERTAKAGFKAISSELPDMHGVRDISARVRRGKLVFTVRFGEACAWEEQRLRLWVKTPDTVVAAMKGQSLADIVEHPLFEDVTVSSARHDSGGVLIETRRRPCLDLATVASRGVDRPLELLDTLRVLDVARVCRVAGGVIERLSEPARQTLLGRLCRDRTADVTDLFGYPPGGITRMALHVEGDRLLTTAHLVNGSFATGRLSLYGGSVSRSQIFSSGLFWAYKTAGQGNFARAPRESTIPLGTFAGDMDRMARYRRVAA